MKIESAELVTYNANNRGTSTGDCTARSISLAFNIDYSKVRKMMNASARKLRYDTYNADGNVNTVIAELGGGYRKKPDTRITVNDFVDAHPQGTYLIGCSRLNSSYATHLVCVIDGVVYDSWDSRVFYVDEYWVVEHGVSGKDITDIGTYLSQTWIKSKNFAQYVDYINALFDNIIGKNRRLKKLADKYNIDIQLSITVSKLSLKGYTFNYSGYISLYIAEYNISKTFRHKFAIAFKPTMSVEEVQPYFDDAFYGKLYSQIQNVVYKVEDICEGYELTKSVEESDKDHFYLYESEIKSFKTLPYWAQRLATYFTAGTPFQENYSDSIQLRLKTPPFDNMYGKKTEYAASADTRSFEAYSMSELKEGLDYYKKTGDYDRAFKLAAYGDYAD